MCCGSAATTVRLLNLRLNSCKRHECPITILSESGEFAGHYLVTIGMKILVIDDEPKAAANLAQGLSESGYEVDVVHDGASGLDAAVNPAYGLIISDVMMPGFDGFSIVTELRRKDATLQFCSLLHSML
jgi:PleD family two-component response regulator